MLGRDTLLLSLPAFQCLANTSRWTKPQELSQSGGLESTACRLQCGVEPSKGVGNGGTWGQTGPGQILALPSPSEFRKREVPFRAGEGWTVDVGNPYLLFIVLV